MVGTLANASNTAWRYFLSQNLALLPMVEKKYKIKRYILAHGKNKGMVLYALVF
jgi:hypothetical protein